MTGRAKMPEALAISRQALAARTATGSSYHQTYFLGVLAEDCERTGEADEALSLLVTALETATSTGERWFEAELHRLRGECLIAHSANGAAAEACLHKAIEVAQGQEAKTWELRATAALARLWRDQGKRAEARDLLAPVYDWFTEGFDTVDLEDARALPDELA